MPARTPLFDVQKARGGKMVDFAGWEMPVQFAGIGAEHLAVRTTAGVFDVSHMGRIRVDGPGAAALLARQVCRRTRDLAMGQVRYAMVLGEDGGAIDDILVSREGESAFHIVCNAGNRAPVLARLRGDGGARITDLSDSDAMIAVQGPTAVALMAGLGLDGSALKYYRFADIAWRGCTVRVSRTGYTGEDGVEVMPPVDRAAELWTAIVEAGAVPCGLGARDTLRLEAAMPLYGHELDTTVSPLEAGLGQILEPDGGYIGAAGIAARRAAGIARQLVGLTVPDRRVPRQGYPVLHQGAPVGTVTSGTLAPTLGTAIGMAFVPPALAAPGTALQVDVRGTAVAATVVPLPFYKRAR
jgi:aminomethyltransferase